MSSGNPRTARVILSLVGLLAIALSLFLSFRNPVGLWHWALLLVALACLLASRRLR
jgi:hypothetical protein